MKFRLEYEHSNAGEVRYDRLFEARKAALSLVRNGWQRVEIRILVESFLGAHDGDDERVAFLSPGKSAGHVNQKGVFVPSPHGRFCDEHDDCFAVPKLGEACFEASEERARLERLGAASSSSSFTISTASAATNATSNVITWKS